MCVAVRSRVLGPAHAAYDPTFVTIWVDPRLAEGEAHEAVRRLLAHLGVPQDAEMVTCWCGDPVLIPPRTRMAG